MPNRPRPKARLSRALGIALTPSCAKVLDRRPYPPGVHGRARKSQSDYNLRLREKQRLRHQYGIKESQLSKAFDTARRSKGRAGEELVANLETRLSSVVLRAGFARSIYQARQVVVHRHITVNGLRVDRPSYQVQPGDIVAIAERSKHLPPFQIAAAGGHLDVAGGPVPPYLTVNHSALQAQLVRRPVRSEVPIVCTEQLVVEFYSR